ncbi:carbamoyltransferase HypF [Methylobacter sp. sgz302048]|uniref:carbamoyltransferase HypF n=1 Tax=Methylobacter sp. sgz302048 TaxID=3455945 RepID=UPI003FA035E3
MPGKAIRARGVVQGVGFRPAIWHLARLCGLTGSVWNDAEGVMIHAFGSEADLDAFIRRIPLQLPPLARLDSLEVQDLNGMPDGEFRIVASRKDRSAQTPIAADAATCPDCLAEIADPANRRYRYPFTNCTHCGPRLSIIRGVPYDRCRTSMAEFMMCPRCRQEYEDPNDRRFHAQANCCPDCGPRLWLEDRSRQALAGTDPLTRTAELIRQGFIVAIKGLGGFHLACNAADPDAVARLRQRKRRHAKPFALMARDAETIARHARLNEQAMRALPDKAAPIVLLAAHGMALAPGIAPDDDKRGFMLPYTPLHSLLMQELDAPIVLTSGNISDEPQCTDNDEAREKLAGIADYWLLHDRAIVNRLDDSVVRVMDGGIRLLRRARGYSPEALVLPAGFEAADNVLAMGAELKNSFCLLKNGQAVVSQHIGDLESAAVQRDYRHAVALYRQLFGFSPKRIAVDLHPDYLSTQYGQALAATEQAQLFAVQHHHAHLAACLAEHGVPLDAPPVLGAIFDGLGLGDDDTLWGGEFLLADYRSCTRLGHFQPIALPGGAQAMREPWRNAYAQLRHYFDWPMLRQEFAELNIIKLLAGKPLDTLSAMIARNLNSPPSSSCGRWFDAFAAALDLHGQQVHYEGQAAIALESLAAPLFADEQPYPQAWSIDKDGGLLVLNWQGLWQAVLVDLNGGADKARIAARIHHSLIAATVELLNRLCRQAGTDRIVLSGGVFQNRLLLEAVSQQLRQAGKTVLSPQRYPLNDGGLALGQAVIAAAQSIKGK